MVGYHSKCNILFLIIAVILTTQFSGILDDELKNIGIVIA